MTGPRLPAFLARSFAEVGVPFVVRFESAAGVDQTFGAFAQMVDADAAIRRAHATAEEIEMGVGGIWRLFDCRANRCDIVSWAARVVALPPVASEPCACDCSPCFERGHEKRALPGCCMAEREPDPIGDVAEGRGNS